MVVLDSGCGSWVVGLIYSRFSFSGWATGGTVVSFEWKLLFLSKGQSETLQTGIFFLRIVPDGLTQLYRFSFPAVFLLGPQCAMMFDCRTVEVQGVPMRVLWVETTRTCDSGLHMAYTAVAIALTVVYGLGIPLVPVLMVKWEKVASASLFVSHDGARFVIFLCLQSIG